MKKNPRGLHGLIGLAGMLALFAFATLATEAGAASKKLLPIPEVGLQRFEPGVRDAMTAGLQAIELNQSSEPGRLAASYGQLGMLFHAHDLSDLAEPCYLNASTLAPGQFSWPYLLAYLYQVDGRLEEAATQYRKALKLRPEYLPALLHLGQTLSALQRNQEAREMFAAALAIDPNNAAALDGLGNIAYRNGDNEKAIEYLEQALAADPQADRLNFTLGMAHRRIGNIDRAREYLSQRGNRNPAITDPVLAGMQALLSNAQDYIKKGLAAYQAGNFGAAVEHYRAALESQPADLSTRLALAWVLELDGRDDPALKEVETVLDADPDLAKAHYLKGALLAKSGLNREAITHLRQAVELQPDAATPRLVLATTLMRSGLYAEAEKHYARLAARVDNDAVLLYRLGMSRLASDRCEEAIAPLESALRIRTGSLTVMQALLRAYSICPNDEEQHRQTALIQAQRLFDQFQRWDSAETLAMALAANARYDEAAQLQQTIIDAARRAGESVETLVAMNRNLTRYTEKQPAARAWPDDAEVFKPPVLTAADRHQLDG